METQMPDSPQPVLLLAIEDNQAYTPADVSETLTLGTLLEFLQQAAEEHGEDAKLILDNGQRYGAQFGGFSIYRDLITVAPGDDDEDEDDEL
jgi:hypothetical protein